MGGSIGIPAVQRLIAEMHAADRKSDGFRFPARPDGAPFDFGDRGINLDNVRMVMDRLETFFECAHSAMLPKTTKRVTLLNR